MHAEFSGSGPEKSSASSRKGQGARLLANALNKGSSVGIKWLVVKHCGLAAASRWWAPSAGSGFEGPGFS